MNSNRSSNQSRGRANGKNRPGPTIPVTVGKKPIRPRRERLAQLGAKMDLAPAAIGNRSGSSRPIEKFANGRRFLTFKEYVQDIAGSVAFAVNSFSLQPGIAQLFAWLSVQAVSYQEYRFQKLGFCYETEKASSSSGKLMMAFVQDASDALPVNKQEMLENEFKAKCAIWQNCSFNVPTNEALGRLRYIRTSALAANLDIKTYDLGNLLVATNGCADTSSIGELYVEYTIELITPILNLQQIASATSKVVTGVAPSSVSFMGTTPTLTAGLDVTATVNTLTFNRVGRYLVEYVLTGTGLHTAMVPVTSASTAATGALTGISDAAANAGTTSVGSQSVNVTARGQTLVLDFTTMATTITASTTRIASFTST